MMPRLTTAALLIAVMMGSSIASEPFEIRSAKSAWLHEGELLVSAGYPLNHEGLQPQLEALWNSSDGESIVDSYRQRWKEIPIKQIEGVFGAIDKRYLTIWNGETREHQVKKAYIFQWGCDESLVPVLSLGPHQFKTEPWEWGAKAFGINPLPAEVELRPVDVSLIPKDFYGVLRDPGGWELWVGGAKRFSYIDRREDHNPAPENLLINHRSGETRKIVEKSPFDVRC